MIKNNIFLTRSEKIIITNRIEIFKRKSNLLDNRNENCFEIIGLA